MRVIPKIEQSKIIRKTKHLEKPGLVESGINIKYNLPGALSVLLKIKYDDEIKLKNWWLQFLWCGIRGKTSVTSNLLSL